MRDYNAIINFKWGSAAFGRRNRANLSAHWFFYKPNTGNLSPAPQAPFSSFCSVPYSGGYPTGYGCFKPCSAAAPLRFSRKNIIKGLTHFAPDGTGDIGNFYNYFIIKPSLRKSVILDEEYFLGGYKLCTKDYRVTAELADDAVKYKIKSKYPVTIYPDFAGLSNGKQRPEYCGCSITAAGNGLRVFVNYKTIQIYWSMRVSDGVQIRVNGNCISLEGGSVDFVLAYSFISFSAAEEKLKAAEEGSVARQWTELLDAVEIKASPKVESLFYTALYNALKRPFIYDRDGSVYDFATLWDMYKTQLPLVFLLYPERAAAIVKGLIRLYSAEGYFHNAALMEAEVSAKFDGQSVCIANILLSMARLYGVSYDYMQVLPKQLADIHYQMDKGLPRKPIFTYNLDIADAVFALKNAYPDKADDKLIDAVTSLLPSLFDNKGVLLKTEDARYYEGSNINYSFRVSASTAKRLSFTDKKELIKCLESFFGYGCEPCKYFYRYTIPCKVKRYGDKVRRFEGLNNEPDMETPYMFGLLGRYDRQNEVLDQVLNSQFYHDDGGLCGNDDSGALSSWYVWNALGLFPVAGTHKLLIGCPQIQSAVLHTDKPFYIEVKKESENAIYLTSATLNGKPLENYEITVQELLRGGNLTITLSNK